MVIVLQKAIIVPSKCRYPTLGDVTVEMWIIVTVIIEVQRVDGVDCAVSVEYNLVISSECSGVIIASREES